MATEGGVYTLTPPISLGGKLRTVLQMEKRFLSPATTHTWMRFFDCGGLFSTFLDVSWISRQLFATVFQVKFPLQSSSDFSFVFLTAESQRFCCRTLPRINTLLFPFSSVTVLGRCTQQCFSPPLPAWQTRWWWWW